MMLCRCTASLIPARRRCLAKLLSEKHRSLPSVGVRCLLSSGKETENPTDWIPPNRALAGDLGDSHLYKKNEEDEMRRLEEDIKDMEMSEEEERYLDDDDLSEEEKLRRLEEQISAMEVAENRALPESPKSEEPIDWLKTRRSKLGGVVLEPGEASKVDIPVIPLTLLSLEEITSCLTGLGGYDVNVIHDTDGRMAGFRAMIFVSAKSTLLLRLMAETLVGHLKARKLQKVGVGGAIYGDDGDDDKSETWRAVDCHNYLVHMMDPEVRAMLKIEELWSGQAGKDLRNVDMDDEDAFDDYIAANPIPDGYTAATLTNYDDAISRLQKNRWTMPHRPVEPKTGKRKNRGGPNRRRR